MIRRLLVAFSLLWLVFSPAPGAVAEGAEVCLNGHLFTVPDGFTIELVGESKLAPHPISADFDELGRLYVTDSSGTNDPAKKQLEDRPHRIVRLEDTDGDGVFDASSVWADRLMFPEGALWHDGSLYVAAPPSIWKLTDTDNDGVADHREEWFKGQTLTGCANDLHGPFLGLDGWIYWCKGAFAEQTYLLDGRTTQLGSQGTPVSGDSTSIASATLGGAAAVTESSGSKRQLTEWKTRASHVFRARPDGSGLEAVMTGGMDNPVDLAFLPNGEFVVSNTFLVHPGSSRNGERDGLIHGVYGGVFGKEHGVLDGHPRTGELMPILSHMGAAAPCGLTRYDNDVFGVEYRDNLFCCQFNKHKVSRHVLTREGGGFRSQDSDFVVSSNIDFHPTDVFEDADGSLLIVDTGGWYKLCCPTSQLHKPDIPGAIYRVRRLDAPKFADPRGLKIQWKFAANIGELAKDARPIVRRKAWDEYWRRVDASDNGQLQLTKGDWLTVPGNLPADRVASERLWSLARRLRDASPNAASSNAAKNAATNIPENVLKLATMLQSEISDVARHIVSLNRSGEILWSLSRPLQSGSAHTRRRAAEIAGRLGHQHSVPALLAGARLADDRFLQHAFTFALIEIADPEATAVGLNSEDSNVRRVAMIALDQMPGGGLRPEQVTPLLTSFDSTLRETARWIVSHHPEWGAELAEFFEQQLRSLPAEVSSNDKASNDKGSTGNVSDPIDVLAGQLVGFAGHPAVQAVLAGSLSEPTHSLAARRLVLQTIESSQLKERPEIWASALATVIRSDRALLESAVSAARRLPPGGPPHADFESALLTISNDTEADSSVRLAALAMVFVARAAQKATDNLLLDDARFDFVAQHLDSAVPVADRSAAADVISHSRLSTEQLAAVAKIVPDVTPLELDRLLAPFEHGQDEVVGLKLIESLRVAKSRDSLRIDSLRRRLGKYSAAVQAGIDALNVLVNVDAEAQQARIEELLPLMATGDVRRGLAVFNSQKASCIACHKLAYLGGNVGPDLSRIGGIRTERDLLESLLYPSLSFVRSYEPVMITTHEGKVFNGLIRAESASEITLATGLNQQTSIAREDIEEQLPGRISVMPAGLDRQLTVQELADLITFLKSKK